MSARILALAVLGMGALGLTSVVHASEPVTSPGTEPAQPAAPAEVPDPALIRITSSFDVTHAAAVLRQVAKLFHAGFVRRDADSVAKDIDVLPAEQSRLWSFSVIYKRDSYPLQIRATLDDFGMLDLDFFSAPAVAGAVRSAVDGYLNARGL